MVVSERLIWLHIPKTAGDATLQMFQHLSHPWRILDPHTDPLKHGTLADALRRAPGSEACAVIINLRRLPEVLVSYFHHMQRHGADQRFASGRPWGQLGYEEYLHYVLEHPETQTYDWILDQHLGKREADHYLRVSDLAASFLETVGRHHPIDPEVRDRILGIRANVGSYERRGATGWFRQDEMAQLYRNCPRWRRCEEAVYGDTLVEAVVWEPARSAT
jgi:hypothetical protein